MPFQPLPGDSPDLAGYDRPALMAIGDSIFNGTRSLTTSPGLARVAVPALVARGLGIRNFRAPDYPRPVLFDLEAHVRQGVDLARLRRECLANAERWFDSRGVWSSQRFFDNIAIAGAEYSNLEHDTSGHHKVEAERAYQRLRDSDGSAIGPIAALYYSLNAAFLLNPSGDPDLDDLTPLEQVASRRPERLLVNIGNNDGLFAIGLRASVARGPSEAADPLTRIRLIPARAARLADILAEHCADVRQIYFNLLIRPRVLANLAPRTDEQLYNTPPDGGYFDTYVGRLGSINGLSGGRLREVDEVVARVNDEVRRVMTERLGDDRVRFVDLFAWSAEFDRKHGTEVTPLWVEHGSGRRRLSNFPFSALGGFRQGGLFGLDNMHPTLPGYAMLANAIGTAVSEAEAVPYAPMALQDAYDADTLLQDPPGNWDFLMFLASLAGEFFDLV